MPEPVTTPAAPPPLVVAASLAGLEGLGLVVVALLEVVEAFRHHDSLGGALAAFFVAYAALLVGGAYGLYRCVPWPRGPVLISQLILLGIAWWLRDHPLAAVATAIVAVIAIAGVVHPASMSALDRDRGHAPESRD